MLRRLSLITMVLCLAVILSACGGSAAQPTAAPATAASSSTQPTSAPPTAAPTPLPPTATPTTEPTAEPTLPAVLSGTSIDMNNPIFKAYFAVYSKYPRRMSAEVYDADTQKTTTVLIETDAKDRLRVETGGAADETFSIIVISPTMYIRQGGTWLELPGAQANMFLGMLNNADFLQQALNAFGELASYTVTPLGPEVVNGAPAMAYSSEFTMKDGTSSKGKAWLGADGLLIQDHTETSSGMVITTTFDYDPGIKVEAPIP
jgi:hypothetical protein